MKKLIALLLALMLMLSMVACAEEEETTSRRRGSKKSTEDTTETVPEETEPEETEPEETEEETEEVTEPEEEASIIGVVDGQVYENAYLGIGCEFDSSWVIATPEEVMELMGLGAQVMGMEEQLEKTGTYYDLYAMTASNESVNITIQKENFASRLMTDEDFAEMLGEMVVEPFENAGMTGIRTEITTVQFAGRACSVLYITGTMYGVTLHEKMVLYREGDYAAAITTAARSLKDCDEALMQFYAL